MVMSNVAMRIATKRQMCVPLLQTMELHATLRVLSLLRLATVAFWEVFVTEVESANTRSLNQALRVF